MQVTKAIDLTDSRKEMAISGIQRHIDNAMEYEKFLSSLPKLHTVSALSGFNQDGWPISLDPRHKVAVHEFPDSKDLLTVLQLRSSNYQELEHRHVFRAISEQLDDHALGHKVLYKNYSKNSGELTVDIVLDKKYKMDEDTFERDWNIKYLHGGQNNDGLYVPVIRVKNSFIQSSTIQMGVLRVLCSNAMVGLEVSKEVSAILRFSHVGDVINNFNSGVERLIAGLFEEHIVENMMLRLQVEPLMMETMITWMLEFLGKQATAETVAQFNLAEKDLSSETNQWIAYNLITWALSNQIVSTVRRQKAQAAISRIITA